MPKTGGRFVLTNLHSVESREALTFIIVTHEFLVLKGSTRAIKIRDGLVEKELSKDELAKVDAVGTD
jgi:ABC-type lipoprotein export system ATPase subunit